MKKKITRRSLSELPFSSSTLSPLLQRIYSARGIQSELEIERNLKDLLPFDNLLGIEPAVSLLADAVMEQKKILVVGDFDADGATSSALSIRALKTFGTNAVDYLVPNRFAFGYGLTPELVEVAKNFEPEIILTVDNGIANHAGVARAKALNMKVIITDHHLPAETLPDADAIVNPNQVGDVFPSKNLAGVGVVFYVMLALRRYLSNQNWFQQQKIPEPNMSQFLDLVALGTIADVVPLDHNNRILVYQGLRRIRAGQCISGILALIEASNRNFKNIQSSDLGFAIAPRLNAAGRLEDMSLGIECLISDDISKVREIAARLNQLNEERRVIEKEMQDQAFEVLKKINTDPEKLIYGVSLFDASWHQGIIGILAGRVKDRIYRPVVAFALANENELKGSARSISGLHIRDILADISVKNPNLIQKFGGHAMAAGLQIKRSDFSHFAEIFNEIVSNKLSHLELNNELISDGELAPEELSITTAAILKEAGPWGQSFPEPLFDGIFQVIDQRLVGGNHLKMTLLNNEQTLEAIAFNIDINQWPNYRCEFIKIAYRLDINEFRSKRSVQLIIEQLETAQ